MDGDDVGFSPRQNLKVGYEAWFDVVADKACKQLLGLGWVLLGSMVGFKGS